MKIVSNGQTLAVPFCASQDIYSLEEQVVGRWVDGKPLYRKVLKGTTASSANSGWFAIGSSGITNIDEIASMIAYFTSGRYCIMIDYNIYVSGMFDKYKNDFCTLVQDSDFVDKPITAVIQYTKTTDQATIELPATLTAANTQALYKAAPQSAAAVTLDAKIRNKEV